MQTLRRAVRAGALVTVVMLAMPQFAAHAQPHQAPMAKDDTTLLAHFDDVIDADYALGNALAESSGAKLLAEGKWGGALSIADDGYVSFATDRNIDMVAGTMMFWIKPSWSAPTQTSHGLVSMGLDGEPSGYFVLSQGWWESGGGGARMYFVYDNQSFMHTSTAKMMTMGEHLNYWHHIALTWAEGTPGHNTIYIDGQQAARTVKSCPNIRRPRTRLFIGSDRGTGLGSERPARALVDELVILNRALTEQEVREAYRAQEHDWEAVEARAWGWLTSVLEGPEPELSRTPDGKLRESRAMLDEGGGWVNSEKADEIAEKLARAGFNVYIPCVWHGRGTRWPCELDASEPGLHAVFEEQGHDPLAYLIERCHEKGIEVHPWFCVMKRELDLHPEFVEESTPARFYDAHRPEFRDFIVGLMLDVISRYDVDGINLDYIRTGGLCKGPKCRAEYKQRFGTELEDDAKAVQKPGWANANIITWQDEAVSDIVQRVAEQGRALKPGLVVSVDGHPHPPSSAPDSNGRNEGPWVDSGWVDVVYNMDYGRRLGFAVMDAIRAGVKNPEAYVDLPGNYERNDDGKVVPRGGQLVADQIEYCRRKWPGNGVGLYLYSMLSEEQIAALRAGPFREDAVPDWK
jgi:uncharacterized lipoprotein YddW (UPF0748 family)